MQQYAISSRLCHACLYVTISLVDFDSDCCGYLAMGAVSYCRYLVRGLLGQGTFGQVFECTQLSPAGATETVAVKVIKNQTAYFQQVTLGGLPAARICRATAPSLAAAQELNAGIYRCRTWNIASCHPQRMSPVCCAA